MEKFNFEAYVLWLSWADFLLASPTFMAPVEQCLEGTRYRNFQRDWRYKDANGFVQDDFVVTKRLTINLACVWSA